jgi:hypothetical protein
MIIRTTKSVTNKVYSATLSVEFSTLETEFAKAYGEPKIDLNGQIPFSPTAPALPPGQITLSAEADMGTVPVSGGANWNDGLDAWEVVGSGTFPNLLDDTVGFYKHAEEVVGDFEFVARLDHVGGGSFDAGDDPTLKDGFRVGLMLSYGDDTDGPQVILGWGAHNSGYNMALWHRPTAGTAFSVVNEISRSSPNGLYFRLTRTSLTLLAEYSLDNGDTWNTIGSTTLDRQAWRVGLFANSGNSDAVEAIMSNVSLTQTPVEDVNVFTIGGENRVLMRSQSPHTFKLDGKLDTEAENKVDGWAAEIKDRLIQAKSDLFAQNDNPTADIGETVEQV